MERVIIEIGNAVIAQHAQLDWMQREIKKLRGYTNSAQDATIEVLQREGHILHSIDDIDKRLSEVEARLNKVEAGWWKKLKARLLK